MKKNPGTFKKVLKYVKRYNFWLLLSLALALVCVLGKLYAPVLVGDAIDLLIGEGNVNFNKIYVIIIKTLIVALITGASQYILNVVNNRMAFNIVRDLRNKAFKKIQSLPLKYIDSHPHGDIVSRVISDADQFSDGLLIGFTNLFSGALTIVGTLLFMFYMNVKIALVVVILTPISLFVSKFIAGGSYKYFLRQSRIRGEETSLINEIIENHNVVKAFGMENENIKKFDEIDESLKKSSLKATFFSSLTNPATRFVNNIVYAATALMGALAVLGASFLGGGSFTVGALSCFLSYANQYTKPFNEISSVIAELESALASAKRLFDLIEETPEKPDKDSDRALLNFSGDIDIKDVEFSYNDDKKVLNDINLKIEKGKRYAIVGPTGCGKTTLINLLLRFYDINSGEIKFDGTDIQNIKRKSLRGNIGMVLQDTYIRTGTVKDNIACGKKDASDEEIILAAKKARCDGFIRRLPGGYDAVISESIGNLSGGQRQLLCIARIMMRDNPVLILDEATSGVDTRTEIEIGKAFKELMKGRTSIIVAHRLSTIRDADMIIVMKEGGIIEMGSHSELMSAGGFYSELYKNAGGTDLD